MQCKTLKIDDTFISLSAIYWSHIDELIKAFLNNHNTSFTSSKALETVLSSLNHISLKKVKFPALHSYCLQSQQYLRQTNITNQFKKKYASEVLAIETQEHKDAATKKGYRNAVLLSSRGADQYYEELVDEEEEVIH
jgi:uroporphyrinogen-III synthase